ncbi:thioredoxin domain-containing protein [Pseudonocardia phyllosphaerae]|uniref:thioredoxin domain-containing protein n=1 Tax=Pseudonocardia phyllosphaerae TaxID=3390502 RepID=UPI00397B0EA1
MATGNKKPAKNPMTARKGPSQATVLGIVVVVVFAVLVGVGVYQANKPADVVTPPNATASGFTLGDPNAKAKIDIYLDFQCPGCKAFEQLSGDTVDQLRTSGQAQVIYHPVAILDRTSPDKYSSRSASAAGCAVANTPDAFPKFARMLYDNQPEEGTPGLPEAKLIELGKQAGVGGDFEQCVKDERYEPWAGAVTQQADKDGLSGTPTVKVNGKQIAQPTPDALKQAVAAAG